MKLKMVGWFVVKPVHVLVLVDQGVPQEFFPLLGG